MRVQRVLWKSMLPRIHDKLLRLTQTNEKVARQHTDKPFFSQHLPESNLGQQNDTASQVQYIIMYSPRVPSICNRLLAVVRRPYTDSQSVGFIESRLVQKSIYRAKVSTQIKVDTQ